MTVPLPASTMPGLDVVTDADREWFEGRPARPLPAAPCGDRRAAAGRSCGRASTRGCSPAAAMRADALPCRPPAVSSEGVHRSLLPRADQEGRRGRLHAQRPAAAGRDQGDQTRSSRGDRGMTLPCTHYGRPGWSCPTCTAEQAALLLRTGRPAMAAAAQGAAGPDQGSARQRVRAAPQPRGASLTRTRATRNLK